MDNTWLILLSLAGAALIVWISNRKTNHLNDFQKQEIDPKLKSKVEKIKEPLENLRKDNLKKAQKHLPQVILSCLAIILIIAAWHFFPSTWWLLLLIIAAALFYSSFLKWHNIRANYQATTINKLLELIALETESSTQITYEGGITFEEYTANPLIPETNTYQTHMHINGTSKKGLPFEACLLITYSSKKITFEGILLKIKSNPGIPGELYIAYNYNKNLVKTIITNINRKDKMEELKNVETGELVYMDNCRVVSSDPDSAKIFLSSPFMRKLMDLLKEKRCYISFVDNCFYLAIDRYRIFINKPALGNPNKLYTTIEDIMVYLNVVEYYLEELETYPELIEA